MAIEEIAFTALHGRKLTSNPKFLGTAEAYFACHIGPIFHISFIYAFIGCLYLVRVLVYGIVPIIESRMIFKTQQTL